MTHEELVEVDHYHYFWKWSELEDPNPSRKRLDEWKIRAPRACAHRIKWIVGSAKVFCTICYLEGSYTVWKTCLRKIGHSTEKKVQQRVGEGQVNGFFTVYARYYKCPYCAYFHVSDGGKNNDQVGENQERLS